MRSQDVRSELAAVAASGRWLRVRYRSASARAPYWIDLRIVSVSTEHFRAIRRYGGGVRTYRLDRVSKVDPSQRTQASATTRREFIGVPPAQLTQSTVHAPRARRIDWAGIGGFLFWPTIIGALVVWGVVNHYTGAESSPATGSVPWYATPTPQPRVLPVAVPTTRPTYYLNQYGQQIPATIPAYQFIPYAGNGGGPTLCRDGSYSHSNGRGTCSHHGGIAR